MRTLSRILGSAAPLKLAALFFALASLAWSAPTCSQGAQQVVAAGSTLTLTATTNGVSVAWSFVASSEPNAPAQPNIHFDSTTATTIHITGLNFGPVNIQLVCTAMDTTTATVVVHHGAANAAANGIIKNSDPVWNLLMGPMTMMNRSIDVTGSPVSDVKTNRWAWSDHLQFNFVKQFHDVENSVSPTGNMTFIPEWDPSHYKTGTCTFTSGSTSVTCVGTQLETDFRGGATTGVPTLTDYLVALYPINGCSSNCFLSTATYGAEYQGAGVTITSQTAMTLGAAWSHATCTNCKVSAFASWNSTGAGCAGGTPCVASNGWIAGNGAGGSTNNNYYDVSDAAWKTYYRTGIDDFINGGVFFGQTWHDNPYFNKLTTNFFPPRTLSMQGQVETMLWQEQFGTSGIRPGFETYCDYLNSQISTNANYQHQIVGTQYGAGVGGDFREAAYDLKVLGLCALAHSDPTKRAAYLATGVDQLTNTYGAQHYSSGPFVPWPAMYCDDNISLGGQGPPACNALDGTGMTATISMGTPTLVTVTGGTWLSGLFRLAGGKAAIYFGGPRSGTGHVDWDTRGYLCTWASSTTCTLDASYAGTFGSGKVFAVNGTGNPAGPPLQPFMAGILSDGFRFWSYILRNNGQVSLANTVDGWQIELATKMGTDWKNTKTYPDPSPGVLARAPWYFSPVGKCGSPYDPTTDGFCDQAANVMQARELSPELVAAFTTAYCINHDSSIFTYGRDMYSAMFAKFPTDTGYDDGFIGSVDIPGSGADYEVGSGFQWPRYAGKSVGFFWGQGRAFSWAAAEAGCVPIDGSSSRRSGSQRRNSLGR